MSVINALSLVAGVQGHITIGDANNGYMAFPDGAITWSGGGISGGEILISPDPAGGFFIKATAPGQYNIAASYTASGVTIPLPTLIVTVSAAVNPVYMSP